MVGTFLSYNGSMIRAPLGGFYDGADTDCCCEPCCCPAIAAAYAENGCLPVTITGDISGTGEICAEATDEGYCAQFTGIITLDVVGGDCDGEVIQIEVTLRCLIGVGGIAGIEITVTGSSATCSVTAVGAVDAGSTCDPLSITQLGGITEIIPTCPCDGGTFDITIG